MRRPDQPNRRVRDPYARWCDRENPRGSTYVDHATRSPVAGSGPRAFLEPGTWNVERAAQPLYLRPHRLGVAGGGRGELPAIALPAGAGEEAEHEEEGAADRAQVNPA